MPRKKTDTIVREYLERVSWRTMDEYRTVIKSMIHGHAGVYALYKGEKLYYVGLATNLMARLKHHLKDRHHNKWDRFSVYLTTGFSHIKPLESLVLRVMNPPGNHVSGRLVGALNLLNALNRLMGQTDADRRASFLGGKFARQRRRTKTSSKKGTVALRGVVERRIPLVAHYKGKTYRASLRTDGQISYKGKHYESPSAVARVILKRGANGWTFWTYKKRPREWVPLAELRR